MTKIINDQPLPLELTHLIRNGEWPVTDENCIARFDEVKYSLGWEGQVQFLSLAGMEAGTNDLLNLVQNNSGSYYGMFSSRVKNYDRPKDGWIDVTKVILISSNFDEEFLCLDYRNSVQTPCLVAIDYSTSLNRWKTIFHDFSEFLKFLGIT